MDSEANLLPFSVNYQVKVRPFIDLVDELRANGLDRDVSLPSVVVIGDQSAGKSSTLEAISGVQLPRGNGIVTRCPLELRLKNSHKDGARWKGCIHYVKGGKERRVEVITPGNVGDAVMKAQNDLTGTPTDINMDNLITLEVESPDIPDLTLIDLPGIARIAVQGQPRDIGNQIKKLIRQYIEKKETIILAVVPCNVDIATTEALKMAQEVDPDGRRTLGVLTKPDLIDRGTEKAIMEILNNEKYKLSKGYTIIKCRGQMDIDHKMSLQEAMEKEQSFFNSHKHFKVLWSERKAGVKTLAGRLSTELVEQIKNSIPSLKEDVKNKLAATRRDLLHMGDGIPDEPNKRMLFLTDLLRHFVEDVQKTSKGHLTLVHMTTAHPMKVKKPNKHLYGDVRDVYKKLASTLNGMLPDNNMLEEIKDAIIENRGRELPRFMCYPVCEAIIREHLQKFRDPAFECLQDVSALLEGAFGALSTTHFQAFHELNQKVKGKMNELRLQHEKKAEEAISQIFAMEHIVFTQDGTFLQSVTAMEASTKLSFHFEISEEGKEAEQMLLIICSYFKVAIQRMIDTVPMAITLHLLENLTENITSQVNLMGAYPEETLKLLQEDPESEDRRRMLEEKLKRLLKASQDLASFN